MDRCCPDCFNDREIKKVFYSLPTDVVGKCPHCQNEDKPLLPCSALSEKFEFLSIVAEECEEGLAIHEVIQNAFHIFSSAVVEHQALYRQLVPNAKAGAKYRLKFDVDEYKAGWQDLRNELKSNNRFFPNNDVYKSLFLSSDEDAPFFSILGQLSTSEHVEARYFRARISDEPLAAMHMGAPPREKTSPGRANPKGISYLYLANNAKTCLSEVRPFHGCEVYVSKFRNTRERRLINLRNPRTRISPIPYDESQYQEVLAVIELLEMFANDLRLPIKPHLSELDYIPTQFLCEFVKSLKYDGIIYESSFGGGINYVFFDPSDFEIEEPIQHLVDGIDFSYH